MIGKELDLAVNAELDVLAIHRRDLVAHIFHDLAQAVLDHSARPIAAAQFLVKRQLNAFLALVFHIGEAHHMCGRLAFGVLALIFLPLVEPLDVECSDLASNILIHLRFDPDEGLVLVLKLFGQIGNGHLEQLGQLL